MALFHFKLKIKPRNESFRFSTHDSRGAVALFNDFQ